MNFELTTRHGRMILPYTQDHIAQELINRGEYEWYVIEILKRLLTGHTDGIFLDIGTNLGTVTLPMSRDYPGMTIHSFEIQPFLISTLRTNLQLNQLTNVVIHEHGLGNKLDTITIRQPDYTQAGNVGALSLNPKVQQHSNIAVGQGDEIVVNVVPLDTIDFDQPIRAVKLDVEGYEQFVIEGALETLKKHNYPPIVYELWGYNAWWNEERAELEKFLNSLGYSVSKIDDTGIATHEKLSS
jgi:FkbM family methyltransferase